MTGRSRPTLLAALFLAIVLSVQANDLDTKMYEKLTSPAPCTRWLNSKGQVGCTSSDEGAYGIFWPIESILDLETFISSKPKHSHMIVVLNGHLLNEATVAKLEKVSRVKGVVVAGELPPLEAYSETSSFPGANATTAGEPATYQWNIPGYDLIHRAYKWPMWSVNEATSARIAAKARANKESGTRHGVLMKQFMFGSKNSASCLHFKYCEPVGGHSVWGLLPSPAAGGKPIGAQQSFVMALARLDSVSLFSSDAVGAEADMSGLIATLAALTTLSGNNNIAGLNPEGYQAVDPTKFKYPILFAFFEAEHWGYAGSTRFLNDWTDLQCLSWNGASCVTPNYQNTDFTKLRLSSIKSIVEARQVGVQQHADHSNQLFVHQHRHAFDTPLVQTVLASGGGLSSTISTASLNTPGLPPSSAFTFLNQATSAAPSLSDNIVVISDHAEHYTNRYYGSRYDVRSQLNETLLTDAATVLARTLYAQAMDVSVNAATFIQVNSTIVSTWLNCLTVNAHCPLFAAFVPSAVTSAFAKPAHYHGPFFDGAYSLVGKVAHDYMSHFTRNKSLDAAAPACSDSSPCAEDNAKCILGRCISSSYVMFHDSYSTGLARNPKGGWTVTNPDLENWTEPYWDNPSFELITVGNPSKEAGFLFWAVVQTIGVFVGIRFLRKLVSDKYEMMY